MVLCTPWLRFNWICDKVGLPYISRVWRWYWWALPYVDNCCATCLMSFIDMWCVWLKTVFLIICLLSGVMNVSVSIWQFSMVKWVIFCLEKIKENFLNKSHKGIQPVWWKHMLCPLFKNGCQLLGWCDPEKLGTKLDCWPWEGDYIIWVPLAWK